MILPRKMHQTPMSTIHSRSLITLLAALFVFNNLQADIVYFNNGDRKEGEIKEETDTYIRLRYMLTPTIPDEKNFPKSDIARIERETPSQVEFKKGKFDSYLPTEDMLTADEYERLIQDKLRPFINLHPGTPEAEQVQKIIAEIQAEKEKVVSGQLKVDGNWLTQAEVVRDDYNIRAYRLRKQFQAKSKTNRIEEMVEALRLFDRFIDPASGFLASTHYPLIIPEASSVMNDLEANLARMIREQPALKKAQDDSVAKLQEPDLSRVKAAIQSENDKWRSTYDAEKRSRFRWLVPYKYDAQSLNEAHKTVVQEKARLSTIDLETLTKQNEQLVAVFRYLADRNAIEAESALERAIKASNNNRDYSRVFADLRGQITTLKNELIRESTAKRTFNAAGGAITGSTGPIQDDRVAAAMAAATGKTEEPAEPASEEPAKEDPAAPIGAPTPAPAPVQTPTTAPAPLPPEEGGFPVIIVVGGGVLLLVLLLLMAMQKKKKAE
jgi:hypothetical protein